MTETTSEHLQCPTRMDGSDTLIAHWITSSTCSKRQGRNYHKCYGCRYGYENEALERALAPLPKRVGHTAVKGKDSIPAQAV